MQVSNAEWSQTEQEIAEEVFKRAYEREINALIQTVCEKANSIAQPDDMWSLHDFLSARRHDVDGKYEYAYSSLLFVFAKLLKEGWLNLDELNGLSKDKLAKIAALARM
jgi:Photoprotection regulator fluorescence recovery protein